MENFVKMQESMQKENVIRDKSYAFALEIVKFCRAMADAKEFVIGNQLLRSGTSIGANVEEGLQAESTKDFIHKMSIALKEVHESRYWLRLSRDATLSPPLDVERLLEAIEELRRILTSIVKTSKENSQFSTLNS